MRAAHTRNGDRCAGRGRGPGFCFIAAHPPASDLHRFSSGPQGQARAERAYGELPLAFEPNAGPRRRRGRLPHPHLRRLALPERRGRDAGARRRQANRDGRPASRPAAAPRRAVSAASACPAVVNDLRGDDPAEWRTEIPTFERVRYPGVYPGIDLDWYGNQRQLEYDFRLAPGADPERIALRRRPAPRSVRLARNGDLVIDAGRRDVRQRAPVAYQRVAERRSRCGADFALRRRHASASTSAPTTAPARSSSTRWCSPTRPTWAAARTTPASAIAVDAAGAAYVTGRTASTDFATVGADRARRRPEQRRLRREAHPGRQRRSPTRPTSAATAATAATGSRSTPPAPPTSPATPTRPTSNTVGADRGRLERRQLDAFVAKLDAGRHRARLLDLPRRQRRTTRRRDRRRRRRRRLRHRRAPTSTDFDTVGPDRRRLGRQRDAFVAKLAPAGTALAYSTYLGGDGSDYGNGDRRRRRRRRLRHRQTDSTDFNHGQRPIEGDSTGIRRLRLQARPRRQRARLLDLPRRHLATTPRNGIAVDAAGAAYVTGNTESTDFDTRRADRGRLGDAAATPSSPSSPRPARARLLDLPRRRGDDSARRSPSTPPAPPTSPADRVHRLRHASAQIEGDAAPDRRLRLEAHPRRQRARLLHLPGRRRRATSARAIAVDSAGAAYVAGNTASTDFDTVGQIEGDSAGQDAFVSKLSHRRRRRRDLRRRGRLPDRGDRPRTAAARFARLRRRRGSRPE